MALICIDYDNTFTADPDGWCSVAEFMKSRGHEICCITLRFPDCPIGPWQFPGDVHYASGVAKDEFAKSIGLKIDIWIDDWPSAIGDHPGEIPIQMQMRQNGYAVK